VAIEQQAPSSSPSVIDATVRSFQLTSAEEAEVEVTRIKLNTDSLIPSQRQELYEASLRTTNAGIQYLLINQPKFSRNVAYNNHLDPRVVPSFLDRIASAEQGSLTSPEIFAVNSLLSREAIVSDANLFKRVWDATLLVNPRPLQPMRTQVKVLARLHDAINFRSLSTKDNANAMSVGTLLLILNYLAREEEKYGVDDMMISIRARALEVRESEIKAWIQENMPDYVDVPLSWLIKVYDLHQPALS